ncbi:hypothetical protein Ndes2526B_g04641 [Nannochloris sp. 'desiccata']
MLDDKRKIGVGLTALGMLFLFLGMLFFFDRGLLAMGNILFLAGVTMTIGFQSTIKFFMRPKKLQGNRIFPRRPCSRHLGLDTHRLYSRSIRFLASI